MRARHLVGRLRTRAIDPDQKAPRGSLEAKHGRLLCGWFLCPRCGTANDVDVTVGARSITIAQRVPRPDTPSAWGFAERSLFTPAGTDVAPVVRIGCASHPDIVLAWPTTSDEWTASHVGGFYGNDQQVDGGWICHLSTALSPVTSCTVKVGERTLTVPGQRLQLDHSAFLGGAVVTGFVLPDDATLGLHPGRAFTLLDPSGRVIASHTVNGRRSRPPGEGPPRLPRTKEPAEELLLAAAYAQGADPDWVRLLAELGYPSDVVAALVVMRVGPNQPSNLSWIGDVLPGLAGHSGRETLLTALGTSALGLPFGSAVPVAPGFPSIGGATLGEAGPEPAQDLRSPGTGPAGSVTLVGIAGHATAISWNAEQSSRALPTARYYGLSPNRSAPVAVPEAWTADQVLLHWPMQDLLRLRARAPWLWEARRVHALCLWETLAIPQQVLAGLLVVDEAWVPSTFVSDALTGAFSGPVHVVPHAIDVTGASVEPRQTWGIGDTDFLVHFSFDANSTAARKNPVDVVRAFRMAFPGATDAKLLIKVRNPQQLSWLARSGCRHARAFLQEAAQDERVLLVTQELHRSQTLGLLAMSDCYISLHRSEGFGYSMAEAMALGVPTVATAYSGNMDFMDDTVAWPIPYDLVPVQPGEYFSWRRGMAWAQPDADAAAASLQEIRAGGDDVEERVRAARRAIDGYSLEAMTRRYVSILRH